MKKRLCWIFLLPLPVLAGNGPATFPEALAPAQSASVQLKNPVLGMVCSAVVPGAGQSYAGSWWKTPIFLGIEIGLWTVYASSVNKGDQIDSEFRAYADQWWDKAKWEREYNPTTDPATHNLPTSKTQQYYEMIGKYDQFKAGWYDYEAGGPARTDRRMYYEGRRRASNDQYKKASNCAMLVLANHVISSLEAGLSIRKSNRNIRLGFGIEPKRTALAWANCATVRVNW